MEIIDIVIPHIQVGSSMSGAYHI